MKLAGVDFTFPLLSHAARLPIVVDVDNLSETIRLRDILREDRDDGTAGRQLEFPRSRIP